MSPTNSGCKPISGGTRVQYLASPSLSRKFRRIHCVNRQKGMLMKYYRPKGPLTGKRLSANTVASFMVAQSVDDPDQLRDDICMSADLLRFLLRDRAISYWSLSSNDWLKADSFNSRFILTSDGLTKVQDRLAGRAKAQSVTREAVLEELQIIRGLVKSEPLDEFEVPDQGGLRSHPTVAVESPLADYQPEGVGDGGPLEVDSKILAAIWSRRGQPEFRARLLGAYNSRCAVTGCEVMDALEAAHITPFAEEQVYGISNGILLRSDVHTLFDLFLLSIDPTSWTVKIAPALAGSYGSIDGIKVRLPAEASAQPDQERLLRHYREWQRRWCTTALAANGCSS